MAERWQCPSCGTFSMVTTDGEGKNRAVGSASLSVDGEPVRLLRATLTRCVNDDCGEIALTADFGLAKVPFQFWRIDEAKPYTTWQLIPGSAARRFPEYVPKGVREDFEEACAVLPASPKAAATLARRALQGMIRDRWKVSKPRLYDEIQAIRDTVDPNIWDAIDAVRDVANIGAHPERDISSIVDIGPGDAEELIALIETLVEDWYIARRERELHLERVRQIAADKRNEREALQRTALTTGKPSPD